MTSQESTSTPQASSSNGEQSIALLLKLAGERIQPDEAAMQRARTEAHATWQRAVEKKQSALLSRRRLWLVGAALAAALVLSIVVTWHRGIPESSQQAAQIIKVDGIVNRIGPHQTTTTYANSIHADSDHADSELMAGETISTANGRVALNMKGLSLRVDRNTELLVVNGEEISLMHGRVYVDSEGISSHTPLKIHTAAGVIQHEGTQFQVSAIDAVTQVQVREGRVRVALADAAQHVQISAGQAVTVNNGQLSKVEDIATFGGRWLWVNDIAPDFDIEGRPLSEFLSWLSREHGWHLRYASAEIEHLALKTRLHGALLGDVQQQLTNTGLITGTQLSVDNGVLVVRQSE